MKKLTVLALALALAAGSSAAAQARVAIKGGAVVPGNNTMFGGQGTVIKTAGGFVDEMIVKRAGGLKISLKPTGDRNRMGQMAALRKELDAARDALAEEKSKPSSTGSAAGTT